MRGEELHPLWWRHFQRITPAHAGRRSFTSVFSSRKKDHPRACGEKRYVVVLSLSILGSPPRMRGEGGFGGDGAWWIRITPAHAGRSVHVTLRGVHSKDHPRACGEKKQRHGCDLYCLGITPAHAGRSQSFTMIQVDRKDHPRACGEKACAMLQTGLSRGSPPRMRGED